MIGCIYIQLLILFDIVSAIFFSTSILAVDFRVTMTISRCGFGSLNGMNFIPLVSLHANSGMRVMPAPVATMCNSVSMLVA